MKLPVAYVTNNMISVQLLLLLFWGFICCAQDGLDVIVMPFHKRQLNKLFFNLESWNIFPPSSNTTGRLVELVIYNSGPIDRDLEGKILNFFLENPRVANIFTNISVQFAQLLNFKDSYFRGTRTMFENLLLRDSTLKYTKKSSVNYVFSMEPDCLPIRSNWLDAINAEIKSLGGDFWMLGSKFKGEIRWMGNQKDDFINHLNGNSIYNIGSQEFVQFYRDEILPNYPKKELVPYDLKISQLLYRNNRALFNKYGEKFIPTSVIINSSGFKPQNSDNHAFIQHICDSLSDFWSFYQTILPVNNEISQERLKSLITPTQKDTN